MTHRVSIGDTLPLTLQIGNYDPAKFVRVHLYDQNLNELPQSPVNLAPVGSLGYYANHTVEMPDSAFVIAQYVVYDDASYMTVSLNEGGVSEVFVLNGLELGGVLPLVTQLYDYDPEKYVRAVVTDNEDQEIAGSPFPLEPVGLLGLYVNREAVVPDSEYAVAQYIVYDDEDYATVSTQQGASSDTFFFIDSSPTFNLLPNVGDALAGYFQPLTFTKIVKTVNRFNVSETKTNYRFRGTVQPLSPEQVELKPDAQRSWVWLQVHAEPSLSLKIDDIVKYLRVPYRVAAKSDWSRYGYIEYHLVEDYRKQQQ